MLQASFRKRVRLHKSLLAKESCNRRAYNALSLQVSFCEKALESVANLREENCKAKLPMGRHYSVYTSMQSSWKSALHTYIDVYTEWWITPILTLNIPVNTTISLLLPLYWCVYTSMQSSWKRALHSCVYRVVNYPLIPLILLVSTPISR